MSKRKLAIAVISDVHLGTYGCNARELSTYLESIEPALLIINGDFIDGWSFSKNYFPPSHMQVIRQVMKMMQNETHVYYLTGNHDEFLRKFSDLKLGNLHIQDKLVLMHQGKTYWFFHGDVFDVAMKNSRWLARLGGKGYDLLILINRVVNMVLEKMGRERISLSKKVKNSVKQAIKFIGDFEETACNLAIEKSYDFVVCGHIHQPCIRQYKNDHGSVHYLNSGDWIENLTALECSDAGQWSLIHYHEMKQKHAKQAIKDLDDIKLAMAG